MFFENENGETQTVNSARYLDISKKNILQPEEELIQRKSGFKKIARPHIPPDKLLTGCTRHLMEIFLF